MPRSTLLSILMVAGVVPFLGAAIALLAQVRDLPLLGSLEFLFLSYAFGICSFMLGSYWGLSLGQQGGEKDDSDKLMVLTNVTFLLAWFCWIFDVPKPILLVVFAFIFIKLLLIDRRLLAEHRIEAHYFRLRALVTSLVCLSLLLVLLSYLR